MGGQKLCNLQGKSGEGCRHGVKSSKCPCYKKKGLSDSGGRGKIFQSVTIPAYRIIPGMTQIHDFAVESYFTDSMLSCSQMKAGQDWQ